MKLHLTATEPSGDLLGREVIDVLRTRNPGIELMGIGGAEMASVGVSSDIDPSEIAILGILEGVKIYGKVLELVEATTEHIIAAEPDAAILIDSWGFTIRVAQRLRTRAPHIRLVKLVGPQVWASRSGRAKKIAASFDQVLCLHQIEIPHYDGTGIETAVIGNPALSRTVQGDGVRFRQSMGLASDKPIVLILPGSRGSEVRNVAPTLVEAALAVKAARPDVQLVAAPASAISAAFTESLPGGAPITVTDSQSVRYDAMAAADLALACSGTVTTELAMQGTPMLVAYKLGWITWAIANYFLYKPKHITLLNIAMDDTDIVPEFLQAKMQPETIADAALELLADPARLASQVAAQNEALKVMGRGRAPTAEKAADAILTGLAG
ncbi:MAG: lipid-A-disaccharide synthase [Pseudomonadota bacterium]